MLVRVHLMIVDARFRHVAIENASGSTLNDQIAKNRLQNRKLRTLKYREQPWQARVLDFLMMKIGKYTFPHFKQILAI